MKVTIQLLLIFFPTFIYAQGFRKEFHFIEEFAAYNTQISSDENGDWSEYKIRIADFDNKLQNLISDKESIIEKYNKYLAEQEDAELNKILEKYSKTKKSNSGLKNELLSWKLDPDIYYKQRVLLYLFDQLKYLKEESNSLNTDPEDFLKFMLLESRLGEAVELIAKI